MKATVKELERLVGVINELTGSPMEQYRRRSCGDLIANIGNYHLEWAYSGVRLVRMENEAGGIEVISNTGFGTKKELYYFMSGFIEGLHDES